MKIAVDAMGGDYAPSAVVKGAVESARENARDKEIILVGKQENIREELEKYDAKNLPIEVCHASEIVEMHDSPAVAVNKKKDSSIAVAAGLVQRGEASALVTAGNTGAAVAATILKWKMLSRVGRPALATVFPTPSGYTILLDVGANVVCKPVHLIQYAVMGKVYAENIMGIRNPKIGLLSVGEESSKGTTFTKEVYKYLDTVSGINFIGNVEGKDIFSSAVDIVVTDGFVGNVVLKLSEGLASAVMQMLRNEIEKTLISKVGALLMKPALRGFKKKADYDEHGGAPLLGVNGVCIIGHGKSSSKAIKNAINVAESFVVHNVNDRIEEEIRGL